MAALRIETSVAELAAEVEGPVLTPHDPGYAEEVAAFNLDVVHRPDVVVGATSASDVQAVVRWAAARDLKVSVQATGHGATTAIQSGVLISTARMQGLYVDPHSRLAVVEAGVKWRKVIDQAAPFELAPLSGSSSDAGAVGYTLGGGLAVFGRTYGFASDWTVAFDVVTPDGEAQRVTAEDQSELFWALRGGKTDAVIVTSMTIELLPVAEFFGGAIYYDGKDAAAILRRYVEWTKTLPDEMTTAIGLMRLPPAPDVPEMLRERFTVHLRVAYVGDAAEGTELMRPMREIAPALIDYVGMMPVTEIDRVHNDPEQPVPIAYGATALSDLSPDAIEALIQQAGPDSNSPLLMVEIRHLGGAMTRRQSDDAVGLRTDGYLLFALGVLAPPIAELVPDAIAGVVRALEPFSTGGSFVNLHGRVSSEEDRRRSWSAETGSRLEALKRRIDPEGRFAFGHWA